MSREIEIDGRRVKVVTISDLAPNAEAFRELCKLPPGVRPGPLWTSNVTAPTSLRKLSPKAAAERLRRHGFRPRKLS